MIKRKAIRDEWNLLSFWGLFLKVHTNFGLLAWHISKVNLPPVSSNDFFVSSPTII